MKNTVNMKMRYPNQAVLYRLIILMSQYLSHDIIYYKSYLMYEIHFSCGFKSMFDGSSFGRLKITINIDMFT